MEDNNFISVDKLIEFGMSLAIAQQMVKTMNEATTNMRTSGTFPDFLQPKLSQLYVAIDGKQNGPFSEQELIKLIQDKKLTKQTFVWKPGMAAWEIAEKVTDALNLFSMLPPPLPSTIKS
ncbi:MAG: DUF4339 domain-containing protein [Bacteroidetes bacterium]|nr:DUF4339 domain-containing protein [Bacteroidota bacterium]